MIGTSLPDLNKLFRRSIWRVWMSYHAWGPTSRVEIALNCLIPIIRILIHKPIARNALIFLPPSVITQWFQNCRFLASLPRTSDSILASSSCSWRREGGRLFDFQSESGAWECGVYRLRNRASERGGKSSFLPPSPAMRHGWRNIFHASKIWKLLKLRCREKICTPLA